MEAYARAILEPPPDVTEDVVNERLAGRLSRQEIRCCGQIRPPVTQGRGREAVGHRHDRGLLQSMAAMKQ